MDGIKMDLFGTNPFRGIGNLLPDIGDGLSKLLPNTRPTQKKKEKGGAALLNNKGQEDYTPSVPRTSSIRDDPPLNPAAAAVKSQPQSRTVDPLLSQLQFFQLVMPFLQQTIEQATSGLQSTSQQYQQDMSGVLSNMPESLSSLYAAPVQGVAGAINNQAAAGAQSALAQPEYSFMLGLIESLRAAQEQALQQDMLIRQLQSQPASGGDDAMAALIASFLQPDATKKKTP